MGSKHVRVIGGGIGGLCATLALAQQGFSVDVFEQAARFEETGAGIQISPNALSVLETLGLGDALEAHAFEPEAIELWDGLTRTQLNHVPLGARARAVYGLPYLLMHRADLHDALVRACKANARCSLHLNARVEPEEGTFPTVAADGVNSAWRTLLRGPSPSVYSGSSALRVTVKDKRSTRNARVWFGPAAHLVEYPIRRGAETNLVAIIKAPEKTPIEEGFKRWHPAVRERLTAIEGWTAWPLRTVSPQAPWVSDHVALVGDAAHAMVPFAAQGAAMAIEDGWILANCMALGSETPSALRLYQDLRQARVTRVWQLAKQNGRIYHLTGPAAFARNQVLKRMQPEKLLHRQSWIYQWKGGGVVPIPAAPTAL